MESEKPVDVESWTSQCLTYLSLTLGLTLVIKYLVTSKVPDNVPPFPAKPYPVLGHLPYFKNGLREQLNEWAKSTGEVFSLYFGPQLVVILNGYDTIHQAFVKHGDTLNDRPPSLAVNTGGDEVNKGIFLSSGQVWKEQRTTALHILRSFGMGKNVLALKVSEEVSAYLNALSDLKGQPSETRTLTKNAVSNVICSIIVGERFEYDDEYFKTFINKFTELLQLSQSSSLSTLFPWLRHLPGDLFNGKKRHGIFRYIKEYFCNHYIQKSKSEVEHGKETFISAYLQEKEKLDKQGISTTLSEDQLRTVIFGLFLAGTDSTSTAIQWFMLNMLHYPDVQAKVFAEISDVVGLERAPTMQDKTKLTYTTAVIMESQRITMTPLNVPHACREDTIFMGYTIPAGTTVISNLDSVFFAPDIWEEPMEFKPERFLDAHGNLLQREHFVPFGVGRRACPGESLAKMELFLFLTALIQRFELRPSVPDQLPTLKPLEGVIYSPRPFQIRFVDRKNI